MTSPDNQSPRPIVRPRAHLAARAGLTKREFLAAAAGAGAGALVGSGAAAAAGPTAPALSSAVSVQVALGVPLIVGRVSGGLRSAHVTTGGAASGQLAGAVAAGGICWNLRRPDGITAVDFRCWLMPAGSTAAVIMTLQALLDESGEGPASVVFESGPAYPSLRAQQRPARVGTDKGMRQMNVEVFDVG